MNPFTAWILYDVANSAFILIITTTLMPIYFQKFIGQNLPGSLATAYWGYSNALVALVVALACPILGTYASTFSRRKKLWFYFVWMGLAGNLLLALMPVSWGIWVIVAYSISRIGWSGSNLFYDGMLVDIAQPQERDQLSARGFAWGYLGSMVPFIFAILILTLVPKTPHQALPIHFQLAFFIVLIWWALFSGPLHFVKPPHFLSNSISTTTFSMSLSFREFKTQFLTAWENPVIRYFLLGYFLYIDAVNTVITMATAYGTELKLNLFTLIGVVAMIQVVGFPSSLLFGKLSQKFSSVNLLYTTLLIYSLVIIGAAYLPFLDQPKSKLILYWALGLGIALAQGGVQSLSRSYLAKSIEPHQAGAYFGLFHIMGRFATILGPLAVGLCGQLTGRTEIGVFSLLVFLILGAYFLRKSSRINWAA